MPDPDSGAVPDMPLDSMGNGNPRGRAERHDQSGLTHGTLVSLWSPGAGDTQSLSKQEGLGVQMGSCLDAHTPCSMVSWWQGPQIQGPWLPEGPALPACPRAALRSP